MSWFKTKITETDTTIKCFNFFGHNFRYYMKKFLASDNKTDAIFLKISRISGIEFYKEFDLEVYELFKKFRYKNKSFYGLDKGAIKDVVDWFDKEYFPKRLRNIEEYDYSVIEDKMHFRILEHQQQAIDRYREIKAECGYRGMLLYGDAGTGKSMMGLSLAELLKSDRVVIICPKQVVDKVWVYSLTEQIYKEPQLYHMVGEGKYNKEKFVICSYERLDKLKEIVEDIKAPNTTVIVDESHNFSDLKSNRTGFLIELIDMIDSDNNILMSGTPLKSGYTELSIIFGLLDKNFKGDVSKRFLNLYKSPSEFLRETLQKRFGLYVARVVKDAIKLDPVQTVYIDVKIKDSDKYTLTSIRKELKEYIEGRIKFYKENYGRFENIYNTLYEKAKARGIADRISPNRYTEYESNVKRIQSLYKNDNLMNYSELMNIVNKFEEECIIKYLEGSDKKDFRESKTIVKYVLFKVQGEALANIVLKNRIAAHRDMAASLNYSDIINSTLKKTIVFSNYVDVCDAAKEKIIEEKFKPITVYGETTKNLNANVHEFTNKKEINPLVTTFKSLSTGVPLIAANVVLVLDLPFRMYIYEQAIARVWRLGQDSQVTAYILRLDTGNEPNINSRNIDIISFFNAEVEKITGYSASVSLGNTDRTLSGESFDNDLNDLMLGTEDLPTFKSTNTYQILLNW